MQRVGWGRMPELSTSAPSRPVGTLDLVLTDRGPAHEGDEARGLKELMRGRGSPERRLQRVGLKRRDENAREPALAPWPVSSGAGGTSGLVLCTEVDEATAGILVLVGGGLDGPGLSGHHGGLKDGETDRGIPSTCRFTPFFSARVFPRAPRTSSGQPRPWLRMCPPSRTPVPPLPDLSTRPLGASVFPETSLPFLSSAPGRTSPAFQALRLWAGTARACPSQAVPSAGGV